MAVINSAASDPNDSSKRACARASVMCEHVRGRCRASLHKSNQPRPPGFAEAQLSASAQRRADGAAFC